MEGIEGKKWTSDDSPVKVLFIRLQALGDTVITMPYVRGFAEEFPNTEIHFLTRKEVEDIPVMEACIDKVWSLGGGRNVYMMVLHTILIWPMLMLQGYDIIFDLQNNEVSQMIRKWLSPKAWSAFDRYSPFPAGVRTQKTIEHIGLGPISPKFESSDLAMNTAEHLLLSIGATAFKVIINPAGFFESRNWPFEYYVSWAKLLNEAYEGKVHFLFVGIGRISDFANRFSTEVSNSISFVNQTSVAEAYGLVQSVDFMLSEDSGLMHMAWTSGIPTLALFGSSRSDWSRPLGEHSLLLSSDDLPCGNCLLPVCKHGDNRCLTRNSPEIVLEQTKRLLNAG